MTVGSLVFGFIMGTITGVFPLEVQQEISVPLDLQHGMQDSPGVVAENSGFFLSLVGTQGSS